MKRLICLLLVVAMLLCGCGRNNGETTQPTTEAPVIEEDPLPDYHFSKLEYIRPDVQAVLTAQEACQTAAQSGDWGQLSTAVTEYLALYNEFDTMYNMAVLRYRLDLSNSDWKEEFNYCSEQKASVDSGHQRLGYALTATEYVELLEGSEYFGENGLLYYKGENYLTPEVEELLQEEARLQNQFYALSEGISPTVGGPFDELGELLVQLVKVRKKIATAAGFESYADFAYDFIYHRDYSAAQVSDYLDQVRTEVAPLFVGLGAYAPGKRPPASGSAFEYVKELAQNAGGSIAEAFDLLETGKLYDIGYSDNKMSVAFDAYLQDYHVPFVFINPVGSSVAVTFTHEFGHFCDDYVSEGRRANVDTAEVYSQSLECLGLFYGDGTQNESGIYSLLYAYVTTAAQADFELRLYELPEEEVTVDNILKLYARVGSEWKMAYVANFNQQNLLSTPHYFITPLYMLSYSVSSNAALQLYELELQESGTGLRCYEEILASEQVQLLSLLEEANLRSPFEPGAVEKSRDTFKKMLGKS